jgi:protein TonB
MSRRLGEEGEAVFSLDVDADGAVSGARLEKSSGHERLDAAAREALLAAKFQPAARAGRALPSTTRMRIEFQLKSAPSR